MLSVEPEGVRGFGGSWDDQTNEEVRAAILIEVGYRPDYSYITKEALNSLYAYVQGEFAYDPRDPDLFGREDVLCRVMWSTGYGATETDEPSYRLNRDELDHLVKVLRRNKDDRKWIL